MTNFVYILSAGYYVNEKNVTIDFFFGMNSL